MGEERPLGETWLLSGSLQLAIIEMDTFEIK